MSETKILYKDTELSEYLGINVQTLRTWRKRCIGPNYIKAEGKKGMIRYHIEDINIWMKESKDRGRAI